MRLSYPHHVGSGTSRDWPRAPSGPTEQSPSHEDRARGEKALDECCQRRCTGVTACKRIGDENIHRSISNMKVERRIWTAFIDTTCGKDRQSAGVSMLDPTKKPKQARERAWWPSPAKETGTAIFRSDAAMYMNQDVVAEWQTKPPQESFPIGFFRSFTCGQRLLDGASSDCGSLHQNPTSIRSRPSSHIGSRRSRA